MKLSEHNWILEKEKSLKVVLIKIKKKNDHLYIAPEINENGTKSGSSNFCRME